MPCGVLARVRQKTVEAQCQKMGTAQGCDSKAPDRRPKQKVLVHMHTHMHATAILGPVGMYMFTPVTVLYTLRLITPKTRCR